MIYKREKWIDGVKLFACVLVVLGHFFQSMEAAGYLSASDLLRWFDRTIYYFHVPLFFLCSGYLHQKSCTASFSGWSWNLPKKAVGLGIPYFVFSFATWALKNIFSSEVNNHSDGLFECLFLNPISPYWYLYALFGIFVVMPAFTNRKTAVAGLGFAVVLKTVHILVGEIGVYMVDTVCGNLIWFALGMCACSWDVPERLQKVPGLVLGTVSAVVFLSASARLWSQGYSEAISTAMGVLGCTATIALMLHVPFGGKIAGKMTQYTMPVFLMHTIFAAGLRAVLQKLGIATPMIHVAAGLIISFVGPIVAAEIMKRLKLDVLYNPGKYFKFPKKTKELKNV